MVDGYICRSLIGALFFVRFTDLVDWQHAGRELGHITYLQHRHERHRGQVKTPSPPPHKHRPTKILILACFLLDFGSRRPDDKDIAIEDLSLLCDLFYLPFEHGSRSIQIINEFYWLKTNACVLVSSYKKGQDLASAKPEVSGWAPEAHRHSSTNPYS